MILSEVMSELEKLGSEQTKQTLLRHGGMEPFFGVKIGDLKKLVKAVKKDQALALSLYETGNHDAMYLAGLTVDPKTISKSQLQDWVGKAYWYMLAEYTVANVAAESAYGHELALEWIESNDEMVATCGWSTYSSYILITPDEELNIEEIRGLLKRVQDTVHSERNRVRYTMNSFVIAVGSSVSNLHLEALQVAERIGAVHVDVGQTACKVPLANTYIAKVDAMGKLGNKRKTCIC